MIPFKSQLLKDYGKVYVIVESFFCTYAYLKNMFMYNENKMGNQSIPLLNMMIKVIIITLTIALYLLVCIHGIICVVYRTIISLILQYKMGKNFGGFLDFDTFFTQTTAPSIITFLFIFNSEKDGSEFYTLMRRLIINSHLAHFKFSSTIENYLGYYYYLKNQINVGDVITKLDLADTSHMLKHKLLLNIMNENILRPMLNRNALWEVRIGTQPLPHNDNSRSTTCKKQYPVVVRYHHCIGDGISILSLWKKALSGESLDQKNAVDEIRTPIFSFKEILNMWQDIKHLENMVIHTNIISISCKKRRAIFKVNKDKKELLALFSEESQNYLNLVKKIKGRFNDITFTEIIWTALWASLHDYYKQLGNCPEILNLCLITRPRFDTVFNAKKGGYYGNEMLNNSTGAMISIPFDMAHKSISQRLLNLHKIWQPKNSLDDQFAYWSTQSLFYSPAIVSKLLLKLFIDADVGISNLPGVSIQEANELGLEEIFFHVPMLTKESFRLFITTQSNCFHVVLASGERSIKNEIDLHIILENMFKYINILDKETEAENIINDSNN